MTAGEAAGFPGDAFERSPSLLAVATFSGELRVVNPAFAAALGAEPQQLAGRAIADLIHTDDLADAQASLLRAKRSGRTPPVEHRWAHADGAWRLLQWSAVQGDGGLLHLGAVDITHERQLRMEIAVRVAHDLRAPLRAIDGFAALLLRDAETGVATLPEGQRHYLSLVRDATAELASVVDGLVEMLRISDEPLRRTRLDIGALARSAWERLHAAGHGAACELVIEDPLPQADGDTAMVQRALRHLLDNAAKASPTRVVVGFDAAQRAYAVRDNGIGFDDRLAGRALVLFGRVHEEGALRGAGAGLAIVARIAERHGGCVWLTSRAGGGTTVFFRLSPGE